jgi:hypothetical protein
VRLFLNCVVLANLEGIMSIDDVERLQSILRSCWCYYLDEDYLLLLASIFEAREDDLITRDHGVDSCMIFVVQDCRLHPCLNRY